MAKPTKKRRRFPHEPGKCHICADKGILPSEAIACALHSVFRIKELEREVRVLENTAGASSRLHLALASLMGAVPSADGRAELGFVKELLARADKVRDAVQKALDVANYEKK